MDLLIAHTADLILMAASLGAAVYCMILSRRLSRLGSFDKGIGGAIAVLSAQVEEMKTALHEAKTGSDGAERQLGDLVRQAREISAELEMMIAACHDVVEVADDPPADPVEARGGGDRASAAEAPEPADPEETDTVPIFGSRRLQAQDARENGAIPLFRHRAGSRG